jgi:alkylhydroperoxidase family enzyme
MTRRRERCKRRPPSGYNGFDRIGRKKGVVNMTWVATVPEEQATGLLAQIYDETRAKCGNVINLVKVQSLRPEIMAIGRQMYRHLMDGPGGLSRLQRVLIATVVSKVNGCLY